MKVIVLLGAPGSGKGTQAPILAKHLDVPHVATGDLFRAAVRDGSPVGLAARRYMERGQLVPDDITVKMLLERLDQPDAQAGVILDGFPRNRAQAYILDDALAERGSHVDRAVSIEVPADDLVRRLSGRWVCRDSGHVYNEHSNPPRSPGVCDLDGSELFQRDDDKAETIRARMALTLTALGEVGTHYRERGLLVSIDGHLPISEVTAKLLTAVDQALSRPDMVTRKSKAEIARMRQAGRIVAEVLQLVEEALKPGVSTGQLDRLAEAHILKSGAVPSFKGYPGINPRRPFPASLCISIDDEIVHGIPGERIIRDGQIVSVDAGAIVDGWHGDAARTFYVGQPPAAVAKLIDTTRAAMVAGIEAARPGSHIEDISAAVEDVAGPAGFGIIRQFVGHGIGTEMHEEPQVPNYRTGRKGRKLEPGLCLAIEPMLTLGDYRAHVLEDDWTVATIDGSLAAHFENTIAITDHGPEVLTAL